MAAVKKINLKASRIKIYYFLIFYQLNKWLQNFVILTLRYFLLELFVRTNIKKYKKLDTFKKVYNNFSLIQFYFFHKICDLYFKGSCQICTSVQNCTKGHFCSNRPFCTGRIFFLPLMLRLTLDRLLFFILVIVFYNNYY